MRNNLFSQKTPHNNKFKPIKLGMKKQRKFCIGFLWMSNSIIVHIQDAKLGKQVWDTLVKMYNTNTTQARVTKSTKNQNEHQWLFYKGEKPCKCSCIYRSPHRWWTSSGLDLEWTLKKL